MEQVSLDHIPEVLREHLAPDVEYEMGAPESIPWCRRARGAGAVAAAIAENFASVREQRTQPLSLVSQGGTVMVMARESGRFADSGEPCEVLRAQQFTCESRLAGFRAVTGRVGRPAAV